MALNIVTINMGGIVHNPFEYYRNTLDNRPPSGVFYPPEWDYKTILGVLTKTKLLEFFEKFSVEHQRKYAKFIEYVKTLELENDVIFNHFFCDVKTADEKLALENKFGRANSTIKRFNPIEFGYDPIYFDKDINNQYRYVRNYSINGRDISVLIKKCLEVPFLSSLFNLDNTEWLSKTYDIERVYDIILYDMIKTYSVYINYVEFDKIYITNNYDSRLDRLIEKISDTPTFIITQEGGFGSDKRVKLEYESPVENGVKFYTYNLDIDMYRINSIPNSISDLLGNKKGIDVEFVLDNKLIRVCGVHCKEPKGERTYEKFVKDGLLKLVEYDSVMDNIMDNIMGNIMYVFDWVYNKYYNIEKTIDVIIGDFNPKNNDKSKLIKTLIKDNSDMIVEPGVDSYLNTTNKIRSGYCAQLGKIWQESKVCKDMVILNNFKTNIKIDSTEVFPDINELITEKWIGDHSAVIVKISFS